MQILEPFFRFLIDLYFLQCAGEPILDLFKVMTVHFFLDRSAENTARTSNTIHREKGNVEWFNLIYLYSSTPDPSIVQNMRRFMNIINVFDDTDDCIACINSSSKQKIVLIVSDNFCGSLLPRIENISHILSIYILSENPDESLSYSSTQIRGVFRSIDDIYEMISDDVSPMNSDILLFQPVYDNGTTINATFLFFQLLGDIILDSNETENASQELIHFAPQEYHGNTHELAQIEDFEKSYKNTEAMSWLSRQCFLLKVKKYTFHLQSI